MAFPQKIDVEVLRKLYYDKELGASAVAKEIGVHLSSIYKSMKRNNLPRRSPEETNRMRFENTPKSFNIKIDRLSLEEEKLKIAGLMLYSAEGTKFNPKTHRCSIDFANSSTRLIKIFITFLRNICRVNEARLRGKLFCYPNQDSKQLEKFWSHLSDIPPSQFHKTYIRKYYSKENEGVLPYGVFHVIYSDKRLLMEIEKLAKEYGDNV